MIIYITRKDGTRRRIITEASFKRGPNGGMLITFEPIHLAEGDSLTAMYTVKFEEEQPKAKGRENADKEN